MNIYRAIKEEVFCTHSPSWMAIYWHICSGYLDYRLLLAAFLLGRRASDFVVRLFFSASRAQCRKKQVG